MPYTVFLWDRKLGPPVWKVRAVLRDDALGKDIAGPVMLVWDHKPTKVEINSRCREFVVGYLRETYPWVLYKETENAALENIKAMAQFVEWAVPTANTIQTRATQLYNAIKNCTDALVTAQTQAAITYRDAFLAETTIDVDWD